MLAVHETGTPADAEARLARTTSWQRRLQLCVASRWLIDGALQAQAFMFSRGFTWGVTLAIAAAWFCVRAIRGWRRYPRSAGAHRECTGVQTESAAGRQLVHALSCGGMLFMLLAPRGGGGAMTAAGTAGAGAGVWPPLALMNAVAMAGSVVVATDGLSGTGAGAGRPVIGSQLTMSCQVTISLVMACLLAQMFDTLNLIYYSDRINSNRPGKSGSGPAGNTLGWTRRWRSIRGARVAPL